MLKHFRFILVSSLVFFIFVSGCNFSEKASTLKDDLINITKDQIALQLENSLNEQFPGVQVNAPDVMTQDGQVNWDQLKQSELGNYVFYSIGNYDFRAVLSGDGTFRVERINNSSGDTYAYAEFKVEMADGKLKVSGK